MRYWKVKTTKLLFLLTLPCLSQAQGVQWASKLLGFSSQYEDATFPGQFYAQNVVGKPNRIPGMGNCPSAWAPAKKDEGSVEWVKVAFETPMQVQQVAISEVHNPGAISRIYLYDEAGKEYLVAENTKMGPATVPGRLFYKFISLTTYKVSALKLEILPHYVPNPPQIDAIAISDSKDSIRVTVNMVEGGDQTPEREHLNDNVNSTGDELCPVIAPDGSTLYFTRQNHGGNIGSPEMQDIWFATADGKGGFNTAQNIGAPLNNRDNNSLTSITPDGQKAFLLNVYNPDGSMDVGISMAEKAGGAWSAPFKVNVQNYYNKNVFGEYCLSVSGKVLVMTVQRDDSYGSKDIYVCFLKEDGNWTEPLHTGPALSTPESEVSPFLAADEKTLYFSTAGWPGYGKNDLFVSRRLDDTWTRWSEPQNLGPVLNSKGWDAYYTIPASGDYAYFVSGRPVEGGSDIFRARLPKAARPEPVVYIKGTVRNKLTGEPMGAVVEYENLLTGQNIGIARSDDLSGKYSIVLPPGKNLGFLPEKEGFIGLNENLDLTTLAEYKEIIVDLYLVPIQQGQVVRLNNIFFNSGSFNLRDESQAELNRLVKMLEKYPAVNIEISGHTDNVGDDQSNMTLSQNRSLSVYNYLLGKGIAANRLKFKGSGETQPVTTNDTPEGRQLNRRVEFIILQGP